MRSWDSVKVTNEKLEHAGRVGVVKSAEPSQAKGEKVPSVDVEFEGGELVRFAESDLTVL